MTHTLAPRRRRVLTDAAFRLWTRSLRAAPHRAPAATPRDVLEAVLRSAARERAHDNVSENVSDVSDVSSPLADARTRKETPALDALAAALFHPCHRDYVPAAFAAAAADAVREDAGRDQWDRAWERRARRRRLMKRPVHVRTRRAFSTTKRPPRRRSTSFPPRLRTARRVLSRPRRRFGSSRAAFFTRRAPATRSARSRPGCSAPSRRTRRAARATRVTPRVGASPRRRTRAPARQRRRRRRGARRRRARCGTRSSRRSRFTRRRSNAGIPIPIALDRTSRDRTSRRSSFLSSGASVCTRRPQRAGARRPRTERRPATGSKPLPRAFSFAAERTARPRRRTRPRKRSARSWRRTSV